MKKIRKAVVVVAGFGTRFLPISKTIPKEMLPVVDKPLLHHIVLELVETGIKEIILVTNSSKQSIKDYFSPNQKLEKRLTDNNKEKELAEIRKIPELAEFKYAYQEEPRGTGDAFLKAKNLVGDEPFLGCWGDDLFIAKPKNRFEQLIEAFEKYQSNIVACLSSDNPDWGNRYGFAKGEEVEPGIIKTTDIIEKPGPDNRPSNLAILSGFVFRPEIFEAWENFNVAPGNELHYIDGFNILRSQGIDTYAMEVKNGAYYDCGNISSYLKNNLELTLKDPNYGPEIKKFIQDL